MSDGSIILIILNATLAVAGFLGAFIMTGQAKAIKENRDAIEKVNDKLQSYVHRDDFREFREEQRDNFKRLFEKVDELKADVSKKADRIEVPRS